MRSDAGAVIGDILTLSRGITVSFPLTMARAAGASLAGHPGFILISA
jgi:hypothetical protein